MQGRRYTLAFVRSPTARRGGSFRARRRPQANPGTGDVATSSWELAHCPVDYLGTVHSFRVDSETATLMNSYTPAGFERAILELGEQAQARALPPADRPAVPGGMDKGMALFEEIGMHLVEEPDVLRGGRGGA